MATGGSIESVNVGGREFAVAADAEAQRKLGGWENEVLANGNGTARQIKTRVPLSLEGLTLEVDDDRGDQEYLQGLADGSSFFVLGVTYASGLTYQGQAQITGEFAYSNTSATAQTNFGGPGKLTKQ